MKNHTKNLLRFLAALGVAALALVVPAAPASADGCTDSGDCPCFNDTYSCGEFMNEYCGNDTMDCSCGIDPGCDDGNGNSCDSCCVGNACEWWCTPDLNCNPPPPDPCETDNCAEGCSGHGTCECDSSQCDPCASPNQCSAGCPAAYTCECDSQYCTDPCEENPCSAECDPNYMCTSQCNSNVQCDLYCNPDALCDPACGVPPEVCDDPNPCEGEPDGGNCCGGQELSSGQECCGGTAQEVPEGQVCCGDGNVCDVCGEGYCCRARAECGTNEFGEEICDDRFGDTVCAVATTNHCSGNNDCCDVCDPSGDCYAGEEWCPPMACEYVTNYEITIECHGVPTTYTGSVYSSFDEPCPSAEEVNAEVIQEKTEELMAQNPCPECPNGQYECNGECVSEGALCCSPGTFECDGACVLDGTICGEITDVCENIDGAQTEPPAGMTAENGICYCGDPEEPKYCPDGPDHCIPEDECCSVEYRFCPESEQCVLADEFSTQCYGCGSSLSACCSATPPQWCVIETDTCFSAAQLTSACVTAYDDDNAPNQVGSLLEPLLSSGTYTNGEIAAIFSDERSAQSVVPGGQRYPIYGIVTSSLEDVACTVTPCDYGEACVNAVNPTTRQIEATCIPAAQIATTTATTTPAGEELVRSVQLTAVPRIIPPLGECLILWSAQGMASCMVQGPDFEVLAGSGRQFAGYERTTPSAAEIYTITCDGGDGYTYQASDSCAINPSTGEF